jgi:hypothetical protein
MRNALVAIGLALSGSVVADAQWPQWRGPSRDGIADKYEELRRYKLAASPTWAHPALLSDAVVVRDADSLSVWALK